MRSLLIILLVLFAAAALASAQRNSKDHVALTRGEVQEAERRLTELGYWGGPVDGRVDAATQAALIAFQKYEGRDVTGRLTSQEIEAIRGSTAPKAREPGYEHVEVDLDRQVLLIVDNQDRVRVLPVSSGNGKTFVWDSETSIAYTPRGRFVVYEKGVGWEDNVSGSMYYANYISGGIAIHGSYDVPTHPASHGCIRIPMFAAREVSKLMKLGTIVLVYDKVSFVSAKSWVENPKLKEAALANSGQQ